MNRKFFRLHQLFFLTGATLFLLACTEPEGKKDSVAILTPSPLIIVLGDTSSILVVSRTTTTATGRVITQNPYTSYQVFLRDTTLAGLIDLHRVIGKKIGETSLKVGDEKSALFSDSLKVRVVGSSK